MLRPRATIRMASNQPTRSWVDATVVAGTVSTSAVVVVPVGVWIVVATIAGVVTGSSNCMVSVTAGGCGFAKEAAAVVTVGGVFVAAVAIAVSASARCVVITAVDVVIIVGCIVAGRSVGAVTASVGVVTTGGCGYVTPSAVSASCVVVVAAIVNVVATIPCVVAVVVNVCICD